MLGLRQWCRGVGSRANRACPPRPPTKGRHSVMKRALRLSLLLALVGSVMAVALDLTHRRCTRAANGRRHAPRERRGRARAAAPRPPRPSPRAGVIGVQPPSGERPRPPPTRRSARAEDVPDPGRLLRPLPARELHVARGRDHAARGGCRTTSTSRRATAATTADRNQVTTAGQLLIDEFDTNILPKESEAFSIAARPDGSHAQLRGSSAWTFASAGLLRATATRSSLIANVRDDNYYDTNNTQHISYIAGFFSSQLNGFFDRNMMTIDAFDWLHRTGANPPDKPVPGDNCTSAPARPFLYEGVFAHEYQHLLEYTRTRTGQLDQRGPLRLGADAPGYVNPATPITQTASTATPVLPRLARRRDAGEPEPARRRP